MSASFTSVSERINSIQAISLPPTPSDLEKVELVQRSLVLIKQATDDIMTSASSHAYALSGIPEAVERDLAQRIAGTATLCRRCEHCLSQCNPRAIAAMTSRDLVAETAQFKAQFEAVAHAAKTALAQVRAAASVSRKNSRRGLTRRAARSAWIARSVAKASSTATAHATTYGSGRGPGAGVGLGEAEARVAVGACLAPIFTIPGIDGVVNA
jgi:cobalamin biosynthesis Mg chelatase CobN